MKTLFLLEKINHAWNQVHSDSKSAAQLAEEVLRHAQETEQEDLVAQAQVTLAFCYAHEGKNAEALDLVNRSMEAIKTHGPIEWHVNANRVIGYVYSSLGDLKQSSDAFEEGLELIKEHGLPVDPHYLNNLAFIYYELGEYELAHQQTLAALEVAEDQHHDIIPLLLSNVADITLLFGDVAEAEKYNDRAYEILRDNPQQRSYLAHCYSIYGLIQRHKKEWQSAFDSLHQALEIYRELDSKYGEATILLDLGNLLADQDDYETALSYFIDGLEIAEGIQATLLERDILEKMAETFKKSGNFEEAYHHLIRFNEVNEQIRTKEVQSQISRLMTEAQVEKMQKDAEIENLKLKQLSEETAMRAQIVEESYQDLKTISEIGRRIIANQDNAEVLYSVYLDLNRLMNAHIFGLCLYNRETDEVEYRAFVEQGRLLNLFNKPMSDPKSLSVQCIREGQEIHIIKAVAQKDYTLREDGDPDHYPQSLHFFPLALNEEVIGAITIQSYQPNAFSERQMEMLRLLAVYISIAMSNMMKSEQLKLQTRQLEELTKKDPLTNLYNLRHMKSLLSGAIHRYHHSNEPFSILVIDLDHFKEVNDTYGHSCGDYVLQEMSRLFDNFKREEDFIARWGGEEFLMLLTNTKVDEATYLAESLLETIRERKIKYQNHEIQVTATIGVADYNAQYQHVDELIERADRALYIGKETGRNQVVSFN